MLPQKQAEEAIVSNVSEQRMKLCFKSSSPSAADTTILFFSTGVLYIEYRSRKKKENVDFKNHVIQWFEVLDGLLGPYWKAVGLAFNCTFLLCGSVIQLIGCASNIYYINDKLDKRTWTYIFGACCATTVFIPSFHNYRIWSFLGLGMTTYTAWYMTIAALFMARQKM
ncbi:Auxin transporter-like protein [Quillaja saponaria]|uniref:Auxin transporter-like protein n=1 Tax=Quillaja saponaria TaxID=32244 RepID=A0AAD7P4Z0_QUISA|nr:Auxin transporter-like protein [Quillaja saponaria]